MLAELICAVSLAVRPTAVEGPFQEITFEQALAAAKKDGKVVMIDFFTTWCQPCKRLDKVTWADPGVQTWLAEKTVALKMDAEKEVELAKRFEVRAYPTMVFVKLDGAMLDAIVGFKEPAEFLELAKDALAGKTSAVRLNEKLEAAKKGLAGNENDPMKRQRFGQELARAGKHAEALAEYLWCFDHGLEAMSAYAGVRLSFLLGYIRELGQDYPAAIRALEERRDKAEAAVLAGTDLGRNVPDMAALNQTLGDQRRNLAVYDKLKQEKRLDERVKDRLIREIAPLLVEAKRYTELVEDAGDIEGRVHQEIGFVKSNPMPTKDKDPEMVKMMEQSQAMFAFSKAQELGLWYEALLGAGKLESATKVAGEIVAFVPKGGIYSALVDRALRAGIPDAARDLVERGRKELPEDEKKALERAAKRIPSK
jgi:thioredoxin-related protein